MTHDERIARLLPSDDIIGAIERSMDDDPRFATFALGEPEEERGKSKAALLLHLSHAIRNGTEDEPGDAKAALARYYPDAKLGTRQSERGWHAGISGSFPKGQAWHLFPAETEQAAIWTALLVARASEHARWW